MQAGTEIVGLSYSAKNPADLTQTSEEDHEASDVEFVEDLLENKYTNESFHVNFTSMETQPGQEESPLPLDVTEMEKIVNAGKTLSLIELN